MHVRGNYWNVRGNYWIGSGGEDGGQSSAYMVGVTDYHFRLILLWMWTM